MISSCRCCVLSGKVSATDRSLVQRIPIDRDVCVNECDQIKITLHLEWVGRRGQTTSEKKERKKRVKKKSVLDWICI